MIGNAEERAAKRRNYGGYIIGTGKWTNERRNFEKRGILKFLLFLFWHRMEIL